jgi:HEAT repeat protein
MRIAQCLVVLMAATAGCAAPEPAAAVSEATRQPPSSSDADARRAAIAARAAKADPESCRALIPSLEDPEEDLRNRAAQALYDKCSGRVQAAELEPALRRSLTLGTPAAAAYLLLGRVSDRDAISALQPFAHATQLVKLQPWMAPVPVSLPASVALLRAGHTAARDRVLQAVSGRSLAEAVFVLHTLDDIHDSAALNGLAALLSDQRETTDGLPSGAVPARRVADLAVDSFVNRLALKVSFPLTPSRRYTGAQLTEVREAVTASLSPR